MIHTRAFALAALICTATIFAALFTALPAAALPHRETTDILFYEDAESGGGLQREQPVFPGHEQLPDTTNTTTEPINTNGNVTGTTVPGTTTQITETVREAANTASQQVAKAARGALHDFVTDKGGRLVQGGTNVMVDAHGICRWLDNNSPIEDYFVPVASRFKGRHLSPMRLWVSPARNAARPAM